MEKNINNDSVIQPMQSEALPFKNSEQSFDDVLSSVSLHQPTPPLKQLKCKLVAVIIVMVFLVGSTFKLGRDLNQLKGANQNLSQNLELERYSHVQYSQEFESLKKHYITELIAARNADRENSVFPKILWMYTHYNFTQEKMVEHLLGNFIVEKAKQSGLEIRFVNSWTAYKFLSKETSEKLTKAIHNMKIEESVNVLLKLALLIQHGGVVLNPSECLMAGNLDFLDKYFRISSDPKVTDYNQVLLFGQYTQEKPTLVYQDYFIAAVKNATLINRAFESLCEIISTGDLKYRNVKKAMRIHEEVMSTYVPHITQHVLQSLIDIYTADFFLLHTIPVDVTKFYSQQCRDRFIYHLKHDREQFNTYCGKLEHIIPFNDQITRTLVQDELEYSLTYNNLDAHEKSYWYSWMTIKDNSRLYEPLPPRIPSFCLIDAHSDNDYETIVTNFEKLKSQTYKKYTAVYFVDQITTQLQNYVKEQKAKGQNLILVNNSGSIGRNYEISIIKHCPNKSFVFVLRRNQFLKDSEALKNLAKEVAPHGVLGTFVGVTYNGQTTFTSQTYTDYNKYQYNGKYPKFNDLQTIVNHFRVFHSDCYKIIPKFDLVTPTGVYLNDRLNFLEVFFYMVLDIIIRHESTQIPHTQRVKWYLKSNNHIFDVPDRILAIRSVIVSTPKWDKIDLQDLHYNYYKVQPFPMTQNMDHLVQSGIPMEQFAVFNPALEYQPYTKRNKPQLIPKIFHIIWIDGELPFKKQLVLKLNKLRYPDFEFKIWSVHNITKQRFPLSYELLMNIYNIQKKSRFSKRATMADVYRHEILYKQGGIYMDTSMVLFNSELSKMLSYKLFLGAQHTFRHRWSQAMCIFAVMPKFQPLLREILPLNTNHYNIFLRNALEIAGPQDFRWIMRGYQQFDPDYLIMNLDSFYPVSYDNQDNYYTTYCYIQEDNLRPNQEIFYRFEKANRVMPLNCGNYYPFSFGKEVNDFGGTWQLPKW